jgi:hypothetical protein
MKYYYGNLADALQAMKHDIKIADESLDAFVSERLDVAYNNVLQDASNVFNHKFKFYVAKESEHLLEPQEHDRDFLGYEYINPYKKLQWYRGVNELPFEKSKTAFRNGMYFPQPKELKDD